MIKQTCIPPTTQVRVECRYRHLLMQKGGYPFHTACTSPRSQKMSTIDNLWLWVMRQLLFLHACIHYKLACWHMSRNQNPICALRFTRHCIPTVFSTNQYSLFSTGNGRKYTHTHTSGIRTMYGRQVVDFHSGVNHQQFFIGPTSIVQSPLPISQSPKHWLSPSDRTCSTLYMCASRA